MAKENLVGDSIMNCNAMKEFMMIMNNTNDSDHNWQVLAHDFYNSPDDDDGDDNNINNSNNYLDPIRQLVGSNINHLSSSTNPCDDDQLMMMINHLLNPNSSIISNNPHAEKQEAEEEGEDEEEEQLWRQDSCLSSITNDYLIYPSTSSSSSSAATATTTNSNHPNNATSCSDHNINNSYGYSHTANHGINHEAKCTVDNYPGIKPHSTNNSSISSYNMYSSYGRAGAYMRRPCDGGPKTDAELCIASTASPPTSFVPAASAHSMVPSALPCPAMTSSAARAPMAAPSLPAQTDARMASPPPAERPQKPRESRGTKRKHNACTTPPTKSRTRTKPRKEDDEDIVCSAKNHQSSRNKDADGNDDGDDDDDDDESSTRELLPGVVHVRARRGEATDSHSLAERVRREKISQRMKLLQDLVPGCYNKALGKAAMLEEIINYVKSLQNQIEFLSMKLSTTNPTKFFGGQVIENNPNEKSMQFPDDSNVTLHAHQYGIGYLF